MNSTHAPHNSFAAVRQLARRRTPVDVCELCSAELAPDHRHLLEPASRRIMCCCDACAMLFGSQGETTYLRVPRRARALPDFQMSDAQWESMLIPINMAFFFYSTSAGRIVALYPSPAGAVESLLDLGAWQDLARANPILADMEPEVEALLVNRLGSTGKYYIAPIDTCYELVGLIRTHWRGLSGGTEVWDAIGQFFERLKQQA